MFWVCTNWDINWEAIAALGGVVATVCAAISAFLSLKAIKLSVQPYNLKVVLDFSEDTGLIARNFVKEFKDIKKIEELTVWKTNSPFDIEISRDFFKAIQRYYLIYSYGMIHKDAWKVIYGEIVNLMKFKCFKPLWYYTSQNYKSDYKNATIEWMNNLVEKEIK